MFRNISEFANGIESLEYDKDGNPSSFDARVAIVALLARVACVDGDFAGEELQSVVSCLTREFDVTESFIGQLLDVARQLTQDKEKADKLISIVKEKFTVEQRERVLAVIWRLVMADGKVDRLEALLAAQTRKDLDLTLEQAARARLLAEKGNVGWLADAVQVSDNSFERD